MGAARPAAEPQQLAQLPPSPLVELRALWRTIFWLRRGMRRMCPCSARAVTARRAQALHAARHIVSTELKKLEVFEEHRNDALGHKGKGEGSIRYAKATRAAKTRHW